LALRDFADQRQELGREQRDRYARLLCRRPQPVDGAVGRPRLHVRLKKRETQTEHAGAALPLGNEPPALEALGRESAEDREALGMRAHRRDRELVRIRVPARRMDERAVDAPGVHVAQRLLHEVGLGAMRRQSRALAPEMDLRVDDQHQPPALTPAGGR